MVNKNNQQGYAIMLIIVIVTIIASLWVSSQNTYLINYFKTQKIDSDLAELELVKERLLQFAVLQPEIYLTDSSGGAHDETQIPSPGYFPCPDENGDGLLTGGEAACFNPSTGSNVSGFVPDPDSASGLGSCNGTDVCLGYVPREIINKNYYFGEEAKFFYFIDERFVNQNSNYTNGGALRFAPLHPNVLDSDNGGLDPVLNLNGADGYVVVLIDPGFDGSLDSENADGDRFFEYNPGGLSMNDEKDMDKVVGITYDEWLAWMARRVCAESGKFTGDDASYSVVSTVEHWVNDYDGTNNPRGSNWRGWSEQCPAPSYP